MSLQIQIQTISALYRTLYLLIMAIKRGDGVRTFLKKGHETQCKAVPTNMQTSIQSPHCCFWPGKIPCQQALGVSPKAIGKFKTTHYDKAKMFHWTEASRLNANIRYLIKGAVLLQIRDTANLSGLLHGKLERLDPLLNFAQLLIADGIARPRFCQLTQQRVLPVVRVAKKSTAFFKWCLTYDFSRDKGDGTER